MLEMRDVDTYYGNIQALRGISLTINDGEIVTLIGANGAGKSTTLMTICGINRPRRGEILWNGEPIHERAPHEIVTLGISQVPEGRLIFPDMTVQENLDLGAFLRRDKSGIQRDMDYVFELFPILAKRRKQQGGTLSGGEQQMLAISRALMGRPRLLLLDDPADFQDYSEGQRRRHHGLSGRTERQSGPAHRPPRLCAGKRPHRHERQGLSPAGKPGRPLRLSRYVGKCGVQGEDPPFACG